MKLLLRLFCVVICNSNFAQSEAQRITYHFPFDSVSIAKHRLAINSGEGYLVLTSTDQVDSAYLLVATSWYELSDDKRSYADVANLLRGEGETLDTEMLPIPKFLIDAYDHKNKCELARMVFAEEGYFKRGRFYMAQNVVLAALVRRGVKITISDYDGEPFLNVDTLNCE